MLQQPDVICIQSNLINEVGAKNNLPKLSTKLLLTYYILIL